MMRWGGSRIRHAHRRRDDDLRDAVAWLYVAVLLVFLLVLLGPS